MARLSHGGSAIIELASRDGYVTMLLVVGAGCCPPVDVSIGGPFQRSGADSAQKRQFLDSGLFHHSVHKAIGL